MALQCVVWHRATTEDTHRCSSATGSLAHRQRGSESGNVGTFREQLLIAQVRMRALALLKKHPLASCSAEVQAAAAVAEHARGKRGGRGRFGSAARLLAGGSPWGPDASGNRARLRYPGHDAGAHVSKPQGGLRVY